MSQMTPLPHPRCTLRLFLLCVSVPLWFTLFIAVGCSGQPAVEPGSSNTSVKDKKEPAGDAPKANTAAHDWPEMRGPEQNGVSRDKNLPESFSTNPDDKDSNII